ncbi:MAG: glycosyltransferase [Deltaproteobacteria bacterium]|nr:glycosyltransferase [Deltaproteobacteria bacterium]
MRVLWFVNSSFPAMRKRMGISDYNQHGWWMNILASALTTQEDFSLGVVWANSEVEWLEKFIENGIAYYCVPSGSKKEAVARRLRSVPSLRKAWRVLSSLSKPDIAKELDLCIDVVEDFNPDIIHVHGTEHFYGLIAAHISQPVVISLQGILIPYVKVYWGNLPIARRLLLPQEIWQYWMMKQGARREKQIFANNFFFQGRTDWDRSETERLSPQRVYFSDGEIMREEFYSAEWSIESMEKHHIYITTSAHPYKGTNVLIEAFARVRERFPDARLNIGGPIPLNGVGGYLRKIVKKLGLEDCVEFLGFLFADKIVQELLRAHVFVLPSFIENSTSSLAEAQLVGTPCVAAAAGGVPSMVDDGRTGLLFPRGDVYALASSVERIFTDDKLAVDLSRSARSAAAKRHDPRRIVNKQLSIYREVIRFHKEGI